MSTRTTPGDWTALAIAWKVPDVTPDTPRADAARMIGRWLTLQMLERRGPPPGWTKEEYLTYIETCSDW